LSETNKLLNKANFLHGFNSIRNKEVQNIYNHLIAKEPFNAIIYAESGFFNLTYADKELGMADLNVARYLLENKSCECDYAHAYNITKNEFSCSLQLLDKIYETMDRYFYETNAFDSSALYINKWIGLYTDSSGTKIDYSKFENSDIGNNKLWYLYESKSQIAEKLHHYRDVLSCYQKIIYFDSSKKENAKLIDLNAVLGGYDSILQIMKREIFIKTDSGIRFVIASPYRAPRYFFNYLSAYLAKRDFENAYKLLNNNTTIGSIPNTKGAKGKVLLNNFPMYQKGESENICDRIDKRELEYSFFNYYSCLMSDLTNKNYENALLHLNNFYKIMEPSFLKLADSPVELYMGYAYQFDYNIFSLKGYILSKLNKKAEAKQAYQQAIKLNPDCREAMEELKNLQ
jgi:tetratricopeptide (TPR) repeat protein